VENKWQYVFSHAGDDARLAVIDLATLERHLPYFDRGSRRLLVNDNPVLPPICARVGDVSADGMSARLLAGHSRRLQGAGGRVSVKRLGARGRGPDARRQRAPPPVRPSRRWVRWPLRFTQKTVLVPAEGEVRTGNIRFPCRQFAGLDYTHGSGARDGWRWASRRSRGLASRRLFNFSDGSAAKAETWSGLTENAGAGREVLLAERRSGPQCRAWTACGSHFRAEGHRAQTVDLKSFHRYLQPSAPSGHGNGIAVDALPARRGPRARVAATARGVPGSCFFCGGTLGTLHSS